MSSFRPRLHALVSCLFLALLAACAQQSNGSASEAAFDTAAPQTAAAAQETVVDAAPQNASVNAAPDASQLTSATHLQTDPARRFVRTAQIRFRVEDVYRSALAIEDLVASQGGFVVANAIRSEIRDTRLHPSGKDTMTELTEYATVGDLTVRVPSAHTQAFLRALVDQMQFLDSRDFRAQDVQFDLLRQQLAYLRGQELGETLGQAVQSEDRLDRKADVLNARAQALAVRDEARVAQQEVEDRVAFATITLSLYQSPQIQRSERVNPNAVFAQLQPGFFSRLGAALGAGWRGLLDVAVALAALWPLWLVIVVLAVGWRAWRVRRRAVRS